MSRRRDPALQLTIQIQTIKFSRRSEGGSDEKASGTGLGFRGGRCDRIPALIGSTSASTGALPVRPERPGGGGSARFPGRNRRQPTPHRQGVQASFRQLRLLFFRPGFASRCRARHGRGHSLAEPPAEPGAARRESLFPRGRGSRPGPVGSFHGPSGGSGPGPAARVSIPCGASRWRPPSG